MGIGKWIWLKATARGGAVAFVYNFIVFSPHTHILLHYLVKIQQFPTVEFLLHKLYNKRNIVSI